MKYGKLINGVLQYAPNPIWQGRTMIANPTDAIYRDNGYLPIENTEIPEQVEGFYWSPVYSVEDDKIVITWEQHEVELEEEDGQD